MNHLGIFGGIVGPIEEQQATAFVVPRPIAPEWHVGIVIEGFIAPGVFEACKRLVASADELPLVDPRAAVASDNQTS